MIKLAKWLYELGYKNGWDKAVEATKRGEGIISSSEAEQMRLEDEAIMEVLEQERKS